MKLAIRLLGSALVVWAGCGEGTPGNMEVPDSGAPGVDAGGRDSGVEMDAGVEVDGGQPLDAGPPNQPPIGRIDSPAAGARVALGDTLSFSATCEDPEGSVTTHRWGFGGAAAPSSLEDPGPVVLDRAGEVVIEYRCRDAAGLEQTEPATVSVIVEGPRWQALVGNVTTADRQELHLINLDAPGTLRTPEGVDWATTTLGLPEFVHPARSPNQRYVAFAADLATAGTRDVYVVDLNAQNPRAVRVTQVSSGEGARSLQWSPDSKKLVYSAISIPSTLSVVDLSEGLDRPQGYLVDQYDGEGNAFTARGATYSRDLVIWSKDSTRFYYEHFNRYYAYDLDEPERQRIPIHPEGERTNVYALYEMPDDILAIVAVLPEDETISLHVIDAGILPPAAPVKVFPTGNEERALLGVNSRRGFHALSPSGTKLVFSASGRAIADPSQLFVADFTDGIPTVAEPAYPVHDVVAEGGGAFPNPFWGFQWAAGDRLVFRAALPGDAAFDLYYVDCSRSGSCSAPYLINVDTRQGEQRIYSFAISDDGRHLAYIQDLDLDGRTDIHYVDLSGATPTAPLTMTPTSLGGTATCVSYPRYLPSGQMVFSCYLDDDAPMELFVSDLDAGPGPSVRLHGRVTATGTNQFERQDPHVPDGFFNPLFLELHDGRLLARGTWRQTRTTEVVLIDPDRPGMHVPVHPPLGEGQNVRLIVGETRWVGQNVFPYRPEP